MKGELIKLSNLIARNIKLYFKDKLTFFVSLITPIILIVLYLTFLRGIYVNSLKASLPPGITVSNRIVNAFTGGWLFSSIMAVSCVTVSFCSNMMVADKLNKTCLDFKIAPVKSSTVQISYVISNFMTTMIVMLCVLIVSFVYFAIVGWYLSAVDVLMVLINTVISVAFGSLFAGIIGMFIKNQGGLSAVSTLVSSMYGFICGAYMPLSMFGKGMRYFVAFLPGTYGTVIFRNYFMNGVLKEMGKTVPADAVEGIRKSFDGSFEFFGKSVPTYAMFLVFIAATAVLFGLYVLISVLKQKKKHKAIKVDQAA